MKKLLNLLIGTALFVAVQAVWADDMGKMEGMSTPVAKSASAVNHKVKKAKKKSVKPAAKETWVCPMGHYSGPKTVNGKCPTCGMDLEKKK